MYNLNLLVFVVVGVGVVVVVVVVVVLILVAVIGRLVSIALEPCPEFMLHFAASG